MEPLWGYVAPVPILLVFVSVAMLAHLDQCSEQLKTLKHASRSLAKTGSKGPQVDPKSKLTSTESMHWRGPKEGPEKGKLSRIRESEILLLFTTL